MLPVSFVIMYTVMFMNVAELDHIYLSLTRFYMALLMVAPMAVLMLLLMWGMFKNKKANYLIIASATFVFALALVGLRTQTPIGDAQYMRAMISHHSSAILTSEQANLQDSAVQKLAQEIIEAQEREIILMKDYLNRVNN